MSDKPAQNTNVTQNQQVFPPAGKSSNSSANSPLPPPSVPPSAPPSVPTTNTLPVGSGNIPKPSAPPIVNQQLNPPMPQSSGMTNLPPTPPPAPLASPPPAPLASPPPAPTSLPPALSSLPPRPISMQPQPTSPLSVSPPPPPPSSINQQPNINLPKGGPGAPNPVIATVKKSSLLKFLPFIAGGIILLIVLLSVLGKLFGGGSSTPSVDNRQSDNGINDAINTTNRKTNKQIELLYWGLFEDPMVMKEVIADFERDNPGVTIRYVKQSHIDYRERLQTEIASGNGPDIFRFHVSWVPMISRELSPMPSSVMTLADYQQTFYPVASKMLQYNGQIVGIPLMYDGLALFYNKQMLQTANASVPTTWRDLQTLARELTVSGGTEQTVQRGGLAIGNTQNVEHFADILGLLILQNGGNPARPSTQQVRDALTYYASFAKSNPVYSRNLPSSTTAFARQEVAMMLAPSWRAFDVIAMNPDLDFGISPVPKLADQEIAWASFWSEGVSSTSKNQEIAWDFLKYLSSKSVMQKLFSAQKQLRAFGAIYPRVDLANSLANDPYASAFLEDAPKAEAWFLSSYTHDNGLNDMVIEYYADAVNSLLEGKSMDEVVETLDIAIEQILTQYNIE